MAKIEIVKDTFDLLANRGQSQYFPASDIMEALDKAQLDLFNTLHKEFEARQVLSDLLRPFLSYETITLASGLSTTAIPADYARFVGMSVSSGGSPNGLNVERVKSSDWYLKIQDVVEPMDASYPGFRFFHRDDITTGNTGIEIYPTSVTEVRLEYLARPTKPVFDFTLSGDSRTEIFASGTSTDILWDETALPELIRGTASYLGVALKDELLLGYDNLRPKTS